MISMFQAYIPLKNPLFRRLWIANLTSYIGTWMHEVGAAWLMTELAPTPFMVSLVRAAATLPVFVLALPAGALADILDRRRYLLVTQIWMLLSAVILAIVTLLGLTTPLILLALTFSLGLGLAMNAPAWQALVPNLVPRDQLRSAISLGSISFNIARATGPALGGLLIAFSGPQAAFALNAISFLAIVVVLYRWKQIETVEENSFASERFIGAIRAGVRYVRHSPKFQAVLIRMAVFIVFASALWALLPLVTRVQLNQGPGGYGILLGAFGIGAVLSATLTPMVRKFLTTEQLIALSAVVFAALEATVGLSSNFWLVAALMFLGGGSWVTTLSSFQTAAQSTLPSWVRARALSVYVLVLFGGLAGGSVFWGNIATHLGTGKALLLASIGMLASLSVMLAYRLPEEEIDLSPSRHWADPTLAMPVKPEDGPVLVTVEYKIKMSQAKQFVVATDELRRFRLREGARHWGLFRDTEDPSRYLEYFVVASWAEHMRQHQRLNQYDKKIEDKVRAFHQGEGLPLVAHFISAVNTEPEEQDS